MDGFLLDRGFQVFIEEYPRVRREVDFDALNLNQFWPGALVHCDQGLHLVSDPLRRPQDILPALAAPVGSIIDKLLVGFLHPQDNAVLSAPYQHDSPPLRWS